MRLTEALHFYNSNKIALKSAYTHFEPTMADTKLRKIYRKHLKQSEKIKRIKSRHIFI